jgi:hypothetical protein
MVEHLGRVEFSGNDTRFNRAARSGIVLVGLVWLAVVMSRDVTGIVGLYLAVDVLGIVIATIGLVRSFRIAIVLDEAGVTVRTTFSTRSWRWEEIRSARTLDRVSRGGALGVFGGITLNNDDRIQLLPTITLRTGDVVRFYALRMTVRTRYDSTWADEAMLEINQRAEARRGGGLDLGPRQPPRPS